jgi:uncharacterized protein YxjI
MNYPLSLSFKILAIAQQVAVTDSAGRLIFYVKQKAFKLKEDVTVYADQAQAQPLYNIKADRILDVSPRYSFTDAQGRAVGAVKRHGMRSIWKAHYEVYDEREQILFTITEANPWAKVADAVLGEVPILGMFTGYLFHPAYHVKRPDERVVLHLVKRPALFESKFALEKEGELSQDGEMRALLALLMLILLERARG